MKGGVANNDSVSKRPRKMRNKINSTLGDRKSIISEKMTG